MDYTRYVVQEQLKELHIIQKHEVTQMMREAAFLESCYETGIIGVMEATKDNLFKDLIDALKMFFANLKSMFKKKSIALYGLKFDKDAINDMKNNIGELQANAKKLSPRKDVPHWKGNVIEQSNNLIKVVNIAVSNVKNNDVKDYTYANSILGDKGASMLKNHDSVMTEYLKNYFRYGGVGDADTNRVTISGDDIAGMLSDMIDYIGKYNQMYAPIPGKTSDKIVNAINSLKTTEAGDSDNSETKPNDETQTANTESVSPYTYLSIEEKYVYETLLPLMVNYSDMVIEADVNNDKDDKTKNEAKEEVEKAKERQRKDGETSVTKSQEVNPNSDDNKEKDDENGEKKDVKLSSKEYIDAINKFSEYAITSFQTSIEERFLYYVDILEACGAKKYEKTSQEQKEANNQAKQEIQKEKDKQKKEKKGLLRRKKK